MELVLVSTFVDFTRLGVYATRIDQSVSTDNIPIVLCATLSATTGAYRGLKLLKRVTLKLLQVIVAIMLMFLSLVFRAGTL